MFCVRMALRVTLTVQRCLSSRSKTVEKLRYLLPHPKIIENGSFEPAQLACRPWRGPATHTDLRPAQYRTRYQPRRQHYAHPWLARCPSFFRVGLFLRSQGKIGTLTIRRSGMLRSYKIGSRPFDTFARYVFLRLARSCRVVEKFDKNHRFVTIFSIMGKYAVKDKR